MSDENLALERPKTLDWAAMAVGAQALFMALSSALSWGFTSYYKSALIKANNKLKTGDKNKRSPYTADQLNHDLHSYRQSSTIYGILIIVILLLVVWNLRKGRGLARWIFAFVTVFTLAPLNLIREPASDEPGVLKTLGTLTGLASLAALVLLLFVPQTTRYFRAQRMARVGEGARPAGLGSLFGPRPPRTSPVTTGTESPAQPLKRPAETRPGANVDSGAAKTGSAANSGSSFSQPPPGNQLRTRSKSRVTPAEPGDAPASRRGKSRNG
ncbi:MAG: hypothetical protein JO147_05150 [Actinobacteria bacterium]|nr:hypothetical protein [Actinomycetota bacterium]